MKRVLTAVLLALSLLPAVVAAQTISDGAGWAPQASRGLRSNRIAVIRMLRWAQYQDPNFEAACVANGLHQAVEAFETQGGEVHWYDTRVFESQYGSKLWREMGNYYSLVIVLNPIFDLASERKYILGDSTNAQLFVLGGTRKNSATTWQPDSANVRGQVDVAPVQFAGEGVNRFAFLLPYTRTGLGIDTLWSNNISSGIRCGDDKMTSLHTGIVNVERILHPMIAGVHPVAWVSAVTVASATDSNTTRMPGAAWATPKVANSEVAGIDSVVRSREYLGPLWKVNYTGGQSVWFYKLTPTNTANVHNPGLIWSVICRFTTVKPITWAFDWDDVTDINNSAVYPRWRASAADSTLALLQHYGVWPTNNINPGNAPGYIHGVTPAGEALAPWTAGQPGHSYLKKLTWVHHAHDSVYNRISSNLVGGFGGYQPSNGFNSAGGKQLYGRRYASVPGPGDPFGIVRRLAWSDSVRRAESPGSMIPNYLTFPANQMLPLNWHVRANAAGYANEMTSAVAECPVDSVLWALDYGINGNGGLDCVEGRKLFLRSGLLQGARQEALWADRDSVVAQTICLYPRERYVARIAGRYVQATILHSFNQGAALYPRDPAASYINTTNFRAAWLLGLANRAPRYEDTNAALGETITNLNRDVNNVASLTTLTGIRDFPFKQSTRIVYQHPGQFTTAPTTSGDIHTDIFLTGIHSYLRVMDQVAGRPTQKCVPAWQVYPD